MKQSILMVAGLCSLAGVFSGCAGLGRETAARELFNGRDLDNWYTFIRGRGANCDPKGVFTVTNGIIHVSGEEFGCITTCEEFSDYHLNGACVNRLTRLSPSRGKIQLQSEGCPVEFRRITISPAK